MCGVASLLMCQRHPQDNNNTNGALAYTIHGSINFSIRNYRKYTCVVYDQTLYVACKSTIERISIALPGGTQTFTSIFNFTTNNSDFITTNVSKRLYSSWVDCLLLIKTFIITTN